MKVQTLVFLSAIFSTTLSFGHGDEDHPDVEIHRFEHGETWANCSFVIHSSLTQSEFQRFNREAGSIIYFQPLSGASNMGKGKFNLSFAMSNTPIDQGSGAWNNTFAHPIEESGEDPHWLGPKVNIPNLRFRYALTDRIEMGSYITKDPAANYGFWGFDFKYSDIAPCLNGVQVAARVSHSRMFGPEDLRLGNTSADLLASKKWDWVEPYVGGSIGYSQSRETTDEVNLQPARNLSPRLLAGAKVDFKFISASVEYDLAQVRTFSFKLGASF